MSVPPAYFDRGVNRFTPGSDSPNGIVPDAFWRPRVLQEKNPVIYMHGAGPNTTSTQMNEPNENIGQRKIAYELVGRGFSVVGATAPNTWGNPMLQWRADDAIAWGRSNLKMTNQKVVIFAASHGVACALCYTLANLDKIACVVGLIPAVDPEDIRINNRWSLRPEIDAAWGISYPTPLPPAANPSHPTSMTALSAIPMQFWYATNDTVTVADRVTAFASATGAEANHLGPLGHTNEALDAVDAVAVRNFIEQHI